MPRLPNLISRLLLLTTLLFSVATQAGEAVSDATTVDTPRADAALAEPTVAATIIKSPNDSKSYRTFELDNGLKVLVISDPSADKAAVSLEVGVGSGDDPRHTQGLAHFLEHMLFLGTDRYPEAGAYQAYISQHGGNHNAFTAHDRTNYFFDIEQSQLAPALDRFSRFFIAPLFSPEYVDRERHAVHSEYQSKLKEDGRRQYAVTRQVINPDHPLATFAVGSLDTLKNNAQGSLIDNLKRFYRQHYQAGNMSLVILGQQPLKQLQAMVEQRFSDIFQATSTPPDSAAEQPGQALAQTQQQPPLFKAGTLPALLQVKSLKELRLLSLTFPVPSIKPYYDRKPLRYLSALLGHEGEGSVLAELKRRGWANSLGAGPGFDYHDSATLSVSIDLTPAGLSNYPQVVELLFQQIERIRQQGVQAWRFDEDKQLSEIAFRFREPGQPLHQVLRLAGKLRQYPVSELLHGDYLYRQFDPQLIRDYLSYLRPDNLLLTLTAADLDTDRTEPRYLAQYRLQPLPQAMLEQLTQVTPNPALSIPAANPFIPQDLSLLPAQSMAKPEVLIEQAGYRLWYQQDDQFRVPKADFYFSFRSPVANDNPRHHVMTRLLIKQLDERLNAFLYPASEAGLNISIYAHIRGFSMRLSGYSDRQQALLEQVVNSLVTLQVDADKLAIHQQELRRQLQNQRKDKPYNQGFNALYERVLDPRWSVEQQLDAVDQIDSRQLQAFKTELLNRGEIEALAHGNLNPAQARALSDVVRQQLLPNIEPTSVPQGVARQLNAGTETIDLEIDHNDSSLIMYLQAAQKTLPNRAQFGLLAKVLQAPFYTELRTEKQRGYVVFATPLPIQQHAALALVIQSPSASPDTLLSDIDSFLQRGQSLIEALDDRALQTYKQGLITELMKQEQKLSQRSNRYWQEIDKEYANFDSREQLVAAIRAVSKQQLLDSYATLTQRKLIIRSTGSGASSA